MTLRKPWSDNNCKAERGHIKIPTLCLRAFSSCLVHKKSPHHRHLRHGHDHADSDETHYFTTTCDSTSIFHITTHAETPHVTSHRAPEALSSQWDYERIVHISHSQGEDLSVRPEREDKGNGIFKWSVCDRCSECCNSAWHPYAESEET